MSESDVQEKRRIYVGGLFSEVQAQDLQEKFSRFGSVDGIQIKVRKNSKGEPIKTFAYLNICGKKNDLDKCVNTFNKAKWKGNTMLLQNAKENFLEKLEKEREESRRESTSSTVSDTINSVAGVQDFTMKGAVPGTPVPGEKNWVVGKYGRVLPIVHIKKPNKKKVIQVDPSKLCHNLKKLKNEDVDENVNVHKLTWNIDDADTEITRKRKGEFPGSATKKSSKMASKTQMVMDFLSEQNRKYADIVREANRFEIIQADGTVKENLTADISGKSTGTKVSDYSRNVSNDSPGRSKMDDSSLLSMSPERASLSDVETDRESADTDEIISSNKAKISSGKKATLVRQPSKSFQEKLLELSSDDGNSELGVQSPLSFAKLAPPRKRRDSKSDMSGFSSKKSGAPRKAGSEIKDVSLESGSESDNESSDGEEQSLSFTFKSGKKADIKTNLFSGQTVFAKPESPLLKFKEKLCMSNKTSHLASTSTNSPSEECSSSDSGSDVQKKSSDRPESRLCEFDSCNSVEPIVKDVNYDRKAQNTARVDAKGKVDISDEIAGDLSSSDGDRLKMNTPVPAKKQKFGKFAIPEFKGRSFLDQDEDNKNKSDSDNVMPDQKKKNKNKRENRLEEMPKKMDLKSSGNVIDKSEDLDSDSTGSADTDEILSSLSKSRSFLSPIQKVKSAGSIPKLTRSVVDEFGCGFVIQGGEMIFPENKRQRPSSSDSDSQDDMFTPSPKSKQSVIKSIEKEKAMTERNSKTKLQSENETLLPNDKKETQKNKAVKKDKGDVKKNEDSASTEKSSLGKHVDDNQRRLETIRERKREIDMKKAAVQQALALVDSGGKRPNKKIIFDSDDDLDDCTPPTAVSAAIKSPAVERGKDEDKEMEAMAKKGPALFDSSGSEEEEIFDEKDTFRIRPQYEGQKGQKLMELQSRFGNDERFRMDERFAESDEEDDQEMRVPAVDEESERSRSLRILEDVVGHQPVAKLLRHESQRKTFKDVSHLHFDPSKEEHKHFEIQTEPKERTAKKRDRKKRKGEVTLAEEVPLPEVSKERYYEVSTSIQDAFKTDKESGSGFSLLSALGGKHSEKEEGDSQGYKVEKITAPPGVMNPWAERFRYDSSEDSEDGGAEAHGRKDSTKDDIPLKSASESVQHRKLTFFLMEDDPRLEEGVSFFKRPEDFDAVIERWRQQRPKLVESYKEKWRKAMKNRKKAQKGSTFWKSGQSRAGRHRPDDRS